MIQILGHLNHEGKLVVHEFSNQILYAHRSIFFDWALGLPADVDLSAATRALRTRYVDHGTEHPMNKVLSEGESTPVRKRGERRRRKDNS